MKIPPYDNIIDPQEVDVFLGILLTNQSHSIHPMLRFLFEDTTLKKVVFSSFFEMNQQYT